MDRQTSFKEEIRKSLISHALVPCTLSILVLIIAFTAVGICLNSRKNVRAGAQFAAEFSQLIDAYSQEAETVSSRISIDAFHNQPKYRVDEVSEIYQFLNHQKIRGDFYLFDSGYQLLFTTNNDSVIEEYLRNHLKGNKNDEASWQKMVFMYDNWNLRRKTPPACVIFRKIKENGIPKGYSGFLLHADSFQTSRSTGDLNIIVTNRFDRVFTEGADRFMNERGKLVSGFSRDRGLFHMDGRWYYNAPSEILDGEVRIYAVSDCTVFIQLILISLMIVVFLFVIMMITICISARTIATKKTDILYEMMEALEEVEKGNLDVKLDICSNDEFEMMGKAFNMMLGSIRHLLSRHRELARENALATVQALESQFNSHFLFNTLESIRYMILFEPKTAETMLVSLSRLLRYSIQRGDEMASLNEETEFADRYLQIMLYRYGERLNYAIHVENSAREIEVPRMILQPLVENSIKYGFADGVVLHVEITAQVTDGELKITVKDDGKGIEEELLDSLKENLTHRHNRSPHIGLYNVHRRIHLLYGGSYGAEIESFPGRGTSVVLTIPVPEMEGEGENIAAESTDCRG